MTRALRIEYEGAWYHIINEGIDEISVFPSDILVKEFFSILSDITRYFSVEIHTYLLEEKGYQLLVHTPLGNISAAMQYLNSVFTQRFNKLHNRKGCLFSGRYKSIVINSDMYLLQVSRYIHWLPAINGNCQDIKDYKWSSCSAYIGNKKVPDWLYCNEITRRISVGSMDYQHYLNLGVDNQTRNFYQNESRGSVLGTKSFKQHLKNRAELKECCRFSDSDIKSRPTIEQIIETLKEKINSEKAIQGKQKNKTERNIAMILCRDVGSYGLREIAEIFGFGHHHSVSVIVSRTRKLMDSDYLLQRDYIKAKQELEYQYC